MEKYEEISDAESDKTLPSKVKQSRNTISQLDKKRLVEAYENGQDYLLLGRQMGITKNTVKNIIYFYNKTGTLSKGKRVGKKPKISEEMVQNLLTYVEKNYWCTLEDMRKYLADQNFHISKVTISRCLKKHLITFKKIRPCVANRNSESVLELRKTYVRRLLEEGWSDKKLIYMDECYFNTWTNKTMGRCKKGERLYATVPTVVGPNICLVLAIGLNGPIHHKLLIGSLDKDSYQAFINEVTDKLRGTGFILIHDNVPIHGENFSTNNQVVKLPPYSPFLNPIESVFSKIKGNVRKTLSSIQGFSSMNINSRFTILSDIIVNEIKKQDYSNLENYYEHVRKFFPKSLLKEEIYGD